MSDERDQNPIDVLQHWVRCLSFMQQSVLISAIRAPDGLSKTHVAKNLWRWYRRCVVISAFERRVFHSPHEAGGGSFTGPIKGDLGEVVASYLREVDDVPHHAHMHLVHAAEIIGYKHPDDRTRIWWYQFYLSAVNDMHLSPETQADLDYRLGDKESQWMEREQFPP